MGVDEPLRPCPRRALVKGIPAADASIRPIKTSLSATICHTAVALRGVQAPRASHYISPLLSCNYASRRMGVTSIPEPGADIAYHIQPDNLLLQAATALMVMPGTYANARISPHGGKASDFVYRCVQMHACKITTSMSVSISSERMLRVTS